MFYLQQTNNAISSLAVAMTANDFEMTIQQSDLSKFPALGDSGNITNQFFYCTIVDAASFVLKEIVLVTLKQTVDNVTTWYVKRAQEGTTSPAQGWAVGSIVTLLPTAGNWNNFVQRDEYVNNTTTPIGSIIYWTTPVYPTGYLFCDGTFYSKTTYASLYAVVGNTWGQTGTTFALPNLMGTYIRGWNNQLAAGYDPNRLFGSYQNQSIQEHRHYNVPFWQAGATNNGSSVFDYGTVYSANTTYDSGIGSFGNDTRPYCLVLAPLIRAQ